MYRTLSTMKKVVFILFLMTLGISCEKFPFLPDKYSKKFMGQWDWIWVSCPFGGYYLSADTAGFKMSVIISENGKFEEYKNDSLIISSDYLIDFENAYGNSRYYKLTTTKDNLKYLLVLYSDTILSISEHMVDACELLYTRRH